MRWNVILFLLVGRCCSAMCHLYEYYFVNVNKTWEEAQAHCRENHTDLAVVFDAGDVERLRHATHSLRPAWIGLHSHPGKDNRVWHWSLPGMEYQEENWADNEPNDDAGLENCVAIDGEKRWFDALCTEKMTFICYNETQTSHERLIYINQEKTWHDAQDYCREHYTDLASGVEQINSQELRNRPNNSGKSWIGLFRDTWRISDGSSASYRNWEPEFYEENFFLHEKCVMMNTSGKWFYDDCHMQQTFFCYRDKTILIKEKRIWEEALSYCRTYYSDLVSITNPSEQRWVKRKVTQALTSHVWLGLHYVSTLGIWFWVSDQTVQYTNWAQDAKMDQCDMSGAMDRDGKHQWFSKADTEMYNFVCCTF